MFYNNMNFIIFLLLIENSFSWRFLPIIPKKIISNKFISFNPGGIYGFYTLGISSYILKNYNTKKYNFIGASSGSWNALISTYKYDHQNFSTNLISQDFFDNVSSINDLQKNMGNYIIDNYKSEDFNLNKLNICISILENRKLSSHIINNFTRIEEAIEMCMLSSHLPFLTSDELIKKYNNKIVFDGGLSKYPPSNISIHYEISIDKFSNKNITSAFCYIIKGNISKKAINNFYLDGYEDSKMNKKDIDRYFGKTP